MCAECGLVCSSGQRAGRERGDLRTIALPPDVRRGQRETNQPGENCEAGAGRAPYTGTAQDTCRARRAALAGLHVFRDAVSLQL